MKKNSKTEKITKQVNETFIKLTKESRTSVRLTIALGRDLNECKKVVLESGNLWRPHAEKHFPHINEKTRERTMGVSRLLDKTYPRSIHFLNITTLYDLCPLCKPDHIDNFLKANHINMEFNLSNKSVKTFQKSVNELILKAKKTKSHSSKLTPPKQLSPWVTNLEQKSKDKNFQLKASNISLLKKYVSRLSNVIAVLEER